MGWDKESKPPQLRKFSPKSSRTQAVAVRRNTSSFDSDDGDLIVPETIRKSATEKKVYSYYLNAFGLVAILVVFLAMNVTEGKTTYYLIFVNETREYKSYRSESWVKYLAGQVVR